MLQPQGRKFQPLASGQSLSGATLCPSRRVANLEPDIPPAILVSGSRFRVLGSGFGFRVSGFGLMGHRRLVLLHTALVLLDLVQPPQNLLVARVLLGCGVENLRASF